MKSVRFKNTKAKNTILAVITVLVAAIVPAMIFGKWIEAAIFFMCHWVIREQFPKQYHHIIPSICRTITASILFFGVTLYVPLEYSLVSVIPISYLISWVGFVKKNSDDFEVKCNEDELQIIRLIDELKHYKHVDLYKMSKEELSQYAASKGLSEVQIDILCLRVFDHLKISEICKYCHFGRTTIKYHLAQIKQKLNTTNI